MKNKPLPMQGSYFVMNRLGTFTPIGSQDNQCVNTGEKVYDYFVRLVFDGTMQLDEKEFIIDHMEVDQIIQSLTLRSSCEAMTKHISDSLRMVFSGKKIPLLALKVRATAADGRRKAAWLEHSWTKDDVLLPLLGDTYDGR